MSPAQEKALSEYLRRGGKVSKLEAAIVTTLEDVVKYLASCGVTVRYVTGGARPYVAQGKRCNASGLVELANISRHAQRLAPFALRVGSGPRRNPQSKS